jgi:acyl-[acyl-carrier-protein] desaturase
MIASHPERLDVLRNLGELVSRNLELLASPDKVWQPTDLLPNLSAPDWIEQIRAYREAAANLSDSFLVVLVGGMITEEALPNYAIALNLVADDPTGTSEVPWARWMRGWTAEENRHGDLLNAYLRLTGRVEMRSVEVTVQHLIRNGFDPQAYPDPYAGMIYTAFQERATKITHTNVGRMAAAQGDANLERICRRIAGDESRHETFYTRLMGAVFEADPATAIRSFREMLRGTIAMPGRLMFDGRDPDLFDHFATVAQRSGAYTVHDYAGIIEHLVGTWNIGGLRVGGEAARAQDYLCRQSERYRSLADAFGERLEAMPQVPFSWIQDRVA